MNEFHDADLHYRRCKSLALIQPSQKADALYQEAKRIRDGLAERLFPERKAA